MTMPGEKEKSKEVATTPVPPGKPSPINKPRPNKMTVHFRPFNYVEPTKSELYEMLRQAVENIR
jgi:hypothetical protein